MVIYLLINRCDIMNLFLLGYLCFCVAINPAESSDWETGFLENSGNDCLNNCSRCDEMQQDTSCTCFKDAVTDKCVTICNSGLCCVCPNCNLCWQEQRRLMLVTQIVISVLFALGMIGLVVVYCKICHRTRQHPQRRAMLHEVQDLTTQRSIIESLRERPPSYNEVIRNTPSVYTSSCNNAPPLYTSPYNRASMQEAPPSYPGTPKPQEKIRDSNEPPSSPPVAQHI